MKACMYFTVLGGVSGIFRKVIHGLVASKLTATSFVGMRARNDYDGSALFLLADPCFQSTSDL